MAQIVIVAGNPDLRKLLRVLLGRQYDVTEAASAALIVEHLRASPDPLVVLWNLYTPSPMDQALLASLEREPALGRHAFLLITSDRQALSSDVLALLSRRQIAIIGMPFDLDEVLLQVAAAQTCISHAAEGQTAFGA